MKKILFCIGFILMLSVFVKGAEKAPSFKSAIVHYSEINCATAPQETLIAKRFDMVIDGGCSKDMDNIVSINPNSKWEVYNSATDNYVSSEEDTWLDSVCNANGIDSESLYYHYWDTTQVELESQTITIPGYQYLDSASRYLSRVPVYFADKSRTAVNFTSGHTRLYQKQYVATTFMSKTPDANDYWDGVFLDNCAFELYNYGTILSGGHIADTSSHPLIASSGFMNWHWIHLKTFLKALKDTLQSGTVWTPDNANKIMIINIGNAWNDDYWEEKVTTHINHEWEYGPLRNSGDGAPDAWFKDRCHRNKNCADSGITEVFMAQMTTGLVGDGSIPYEQCFLDNLAMLHVIRANLNSAYLFNYGSGQTYEAGWDTLTWRGCLEYDIGTATDTTNYSFQTGTDPHGYHYHIASRPYTNALVLCRIRGNYTEDSDDLTKVSVNLGGNYKRLNPDGTLGSTITSIDMRNGQGEIMISTEAPPSERKCILFKK